MLRHIFVLVTLEVRLVSPAACEDEKQLVLGCRRITAPVVHGRYGA